MGTVLMDKMAGICKRSEERFTRVQTDLGKVDVELSSACNWLGDVQDVIDNLERKVGQLLVSGTAMREEMDWMRADMDSLLVLNQRMVKSTLQLRMSLHQKKTNYQP